MHGIMQGEQKAVYRKQRAVGKGEREMGKDKIKD
jgi:hypothetical protein